MGINFFWGLSAEKKRKSSFVRDEKCAILRQLYVYSCDLFEPLRTVILLLPFMEKHSQFVNATLNFWVQYV